MPTESPNYINQSPVVQMFTIREVVQMAAISAWKNGREKTFQRLHEIVPHTQLEEYKLRTIKLYNYLKFHNFRIEELCWKTKAPSIRVRDRVVYKRYRNKVGIMGTVRGIEGNSTYKIHWDIDRGINNVSHHEKDEIALLKPTPDDADYSQ